MSWVIHHTQTEAMAVTQTVPLGQLTLDPAEFISMEMTFVILHFKSAKSMTDWLCSSSAVNVLAEIQNNENSNALKSPSE